MSKLLYIPTGAICSFHMEGEGRRTLIVENSALFMQWKNVATVLEVLVKDMNSTGNRTRFMEVNNISKPVMKEEFEVMYE